GDEPRAAYRAEVRPLGVLRAAVRAGRHGGSLGLRLRSRAMTVGGSHGPIDERLLDVRTPGELAFSPDGSMVVFALHATVADVGSHPPSDLYLVDQASDTPVPISSGAWSDRRPAGPPDGARVGFPPGRT